MTIDKVPKYFVDHDKRSVIEKRAAASLGTCGVGPESGEEVRSRDTRLKNHFQLMREYET
jgi:hypothetical protein